jgi:hypothetical protein
MNDPFVSGARSLKQSLDKGLITRAQYDTMYAALAAAAEADTVRCEVEGCDDTAYIGARCAAHFDRTTLPAIVAEMRARHV